MSFSNVNINGKSSFLVRAAWYENSCELSVYDYEDSKTWKGKVSEQEAQTTAAAHSMNLADYKAELEQALRPDLSEASKPYACTLVDKKFSVKKAASSGLVFLLLSTIMEEIPLESSLPEFMPAIAQQISKSREDVAQKDEAIENLTKERDMLLARCNSYGNIAQDLPSYLYAQFAEAFNSLKRRLEAEDDSVHKEQPKINKNIHGASTSKKQPADDEMDDSYGDDTDIDTDNEK